MVDIVFCLTILATCHDRALVVSHGRRANGLYSLHVGQRESYMPWPGGTYQSIRRSAPTCPGLLNHSNNRTCDSRSFPTRIVTFIPSVCRTMAACNRDVNNHFYKVHTVIIHRRGRDVVVGMKHGFIFRWCSRKEDLGVWGLNVSLYFFQ